MTPDDAVGDEGPREGPEGPGHETPPEGEREELELKAELERLREELVALKQERMRLAGAVERLLRHLIGVSETVERVAGLYELSEDANARALSEGLRMVSSAIERALREEGVEVIGFVGSRFDPALHEAVGFVESEEHEEGTVVSVVEKGFAYAGKVLRPAKVLVAKRPQPEGAGEAGRVT
ncbi:MAG: nucleotide exchange factor GrpE [Nitrososphaerota archaeon]